MVIHRGRRYNIMVSAWQCGHWRHHGLIFVHAFDKLSIQSIKEAEKRLTYRSLLNMTQTVFLLTFSDKTQTCIAQIKYWVYTVKELPCFFCCYISKVSEGHLLPGIISLLTEIDAWTHFGTFKSALTDCLHSLFCMWQLWWQHLRFIFFLKKCYWFNIVDLVRNWPCWFNTLKNKKLKHLKVHRCLIRTHFFILYQSQLFSVLKSRCHACTSSVNCDMSFHTRHLIQLIKFLIQDVCLIYW